MVIHSSLSNKYYICLDQDKEPILWTITDTVRPDCVYWGKVFEAMEEELKVSGLTFYLTSNIYRLPSYGSDVVAVVLEDESSRIPTYFHKVKAVFKCYGTQQILGCNPFLNPSVLNYLTLVYFLKNWFKGLPSKFFYYVYYIKSWLLMKKERPSIYDLPLGYFNQLELPIKSLEERQYDVFFAGSILHGPQHKLPKIDFLRDCFNTPKSLSRKQMLFRLQEFKETHPEFSIEFILTGGFLPAHASTHSATERYSNNMMNAKICLVPRGASFETFRFFEGLRYGCIVVAEVLPSYWFYQDSPAVQVQNWSQLPKILEALLNNNQHLHKKHQESLDWWQTHCSEAAVGKFIAKQLKTLSS